MDGIINLKVNSVEVSCSTKKETVYCTLLMDDVPKGHLIFEVGEYQIFAASLKLGTNQTQGELVDQSDDKVFRDWAGRKE